MSARGLAGSKRILPALALSALAASAHTATPVRALRLQLEGDALSGLATYRVPAGAAADLLLALPLGAGEQRARALGLRMATEALRGLRIGGASPSLLEARARKDASGGLEAALLVHAPGGEVLRLEVEDGLPLPVTLVAPSGVRLTLLSGAGAGAPGGLLLHPAPGRPCVVRVQGAGPLR